MYIIRIRIIKIKKKKKNHNNRNQCSGEKCDTYSQQEAFLRKERWLQSFLAGSGFLFGPSCRGA